jgi:hypothetical protein
MTVEVECDPSFTDKPILTVDDSDLCKPKVSLTHKAGCPIYESTTLIRYFNSHPTILGVAFLIYGAILVFLGGKYLP